MRINLISLQGYFVILTQKKRKRKIADRNLAMGKFLLVIIMVLLELFAIMNLEIPSSMDLKTFNCCNQISQLKKMLEFLIIQGKVSFITDLVFSFPLYHSNFGILWLWGGIGRAKFKSKVNYILESGLYKYFYNFSNEKSLKFHEHLEGYQTNRCARR